MPFIQRVVEPIYLSRQSLHKEDGEALVKDYELEAVTNNSLTNALRQLASLVLIANDIFDDLAKQLQDVCARSNKLRTRINLLEENVLAFDPKKVTVPESDICTFSLRTEHFLSCQTPSTALFVADTRPDAVRRLYAAAARTPVHVMRQMDRHRHDGRRSSRFFTCTPVLGAKRRHPGLGLRNGDAINNIDIETHMPAAVAALRRWTSAEALGDVTVTPDCVVQRRDAALPLDETDHRLPSPEEQLATVALRFPAELVPVDVSGKAFHRMSLLRRSQQGVSYQQQQHGGDSRARRKARGRRRNTIAGTDRNEIHKALAGSSEDQTTVRSASTDLLRASSESPPDSGASTATRKALQHFNSLKQWGKVKLRLMRPGRQPQPPLSDADASPPPIYESVAPQRQRQLPISTPLSGAMGVAVKLREKRQSSHQAAHSSSGNWSQSSESGRASLGSSSSHPPKSTTTLPNTSASSSVSEGTLTPDLSSAAARSHMADDGETSSCYSCDTEGYYTSFHVDSGLKTLKEEDSSSLPQTPLHSTSALSPGASLTAESEYELFGKGSTSTTTSSAGTVCTTLAAAPSPAVPERKSSLVVSALVHEPSASAESPDSGHNTSSSPVESASPQGTMGRGSECDFSESDLEGVDRIERIRVKTTINSSRIPSMCVITPPQSDDEGSVMGSLKAAPTSPVDAVRNQLNSMLGKVKDALSSRKSPDVVGVVDAGDYVTIADVRGGGAAHAPVASPPLYSNAMPPFLATRETEYVSLNDLPKPRAAAHPALLTSPSDSLERKKRQGARVTLDSEGKVVYSSDSLKRNKGAHTTFEPGPYVKEAGGGGASPSDSPLPTHRAPKANIRPVQLSHRPASPQVIIRAGSAATPTTATSPTSPQPPRGAYVNVQSPERRCVSPPRAVAHQEEEEGYSMVNRIRTVQPPRYISPPHPPWPQTLNRSSGPPGDAVHSTPAYWTLPTRRPQQELLRNQAFDVTSGGSQLQTAAGSGRFNTIAATSNVNRLHKFHGAQNYNNLNNGAYTSSHNGGKQTTFNVVSPSYEQSPRKQSTFNVAPPSYEQSLRKQMTSQVPGRQIHAPTPASVPTVPRNPYFSPRDHKIQSAAQTFTSSTPTKDGNALMDMSTNYSPIQRQADYNRADVNSALTANRRNVLQEQQLTPKKTMTAEELFAAIHKSKKRLNIKTDFDTYSRSGSPSCSSVNSLSPGSSESSINGKRPEQGSFAPDKNRNRHSWSPNNEDVNLESVQRSYSPTVGTVGSRQSWACDRVGLPSQTSRNDFKRLLLQHGSKSSATQISGHQGGGGGGRMSAVEQLKLSRQQNANGCYNPSRNPVEKRSNGPKLLQSPRSAAATWRFASPRTDVLSTTIPEDCAEDEDNSTPSPKHYERNQQAEKNFDSYPVKNALTNSNVRRPLEMSYGPGTQKPVVKAEGLKKHDISAILQQYQNKSPVVKQSNEGIIGSKVVSPPPNNIVNIKTSSPRAKPHSPIVLSPSNVKENLNSNQFNYPTGYSNYMNKSLTEANNALPSTFKSPQLILQQQRAMRMSPVTIQTGVERQKLNYNGSPGRPILASIDTKSTMQSTLETAL